MKRRLSSLLVCLLSLFMAVSCAERVETQNTIQFVDAKVIADKNKIRAELKTELNLLEEATGKLSTILKVLLEAFDGSNASIDDKVQVYIQDGKIKTLFTQVATADLGELMIDGNTFRLQRELEYKFKGEKNNLKVIISGLHKDGKVQSHQLLIVGKESYEISRKESGIKSRLDMKSLANLLVDLHGSEFQIDRLNLNIELNVDEKMVRLSKADENEDLTMNLFSDDLYIALTKFDLTIKDKKIVKPQEGDIEVKVYSKVNSLLSGTIDHNGIRFSNDILSRNSNASIKFNLKWDDLD